MDDPLFIFDRGSDESFVQLREVLGVRHWHPVVAAEVANLTFDAALFVAFAWRAEGGHIAPVRTKSNEAFCLFTAMSAQNPSHRAAQVVIAKRMKYSTEACEGQLMSFQKRLLCGPRIGAMKRCAAVHAAHGKDLQLHSLTPQVGVGFVPINLGLCRWRITLRDEDFLFRHPQLPLAKAHILANPRLAYRPVRTLHLQTLVDPRRGVPLLAGCGEIGGQDAIDEWHHRPQSRTLAGLIYTFRRYCAGECLADHPAMHAELACHSPNAASSKLMLSPNLLE